MSKKSTIDSRVVPTQEGNGFVAIVEMDGAVIYDSVANHGKQRGVFPSEAMASAHATAMVNAHRKVDAEKDALRSARALQMADKVINHRAMELEELRLAERLKRAAKTAKENIEEIQARLDELARDAKDPRVRIDWPNVDQPGIVKIVAEPSVWDSEYVPSAPADSQQVSIPGIDWSAIEEGDALRRLAGYGKAILVVEGDELRIVFGNDEHVVVVRGGEIEYTRPEPEPARAVEPKSGALGDKALRERLQHLDRAETLLGIYVLEQRRKKPRQRVLDALSERAADITDPRLITDMGAADDGRESFAIRPDFAAAVLATADSKISDNDLEYFVPDCGDHTVLGWILGEEEERGDEGRSELITIVKSRLDELGPKPQRHRDEVTQVH